jgi:hypothetical protein
MVVFEVLLGISETFLCPVSALLVKTVLLLDMLQVLMLPIGTLMCLKPKLFLFIISYNCTSYLLIIKALIAFKIYLYISSHRINGGVTASDAWLFCKWYKLPCSIFCVCFILFVSFRAYFIILLWAVEQALKEMTNWIELLSRGRVPDTINLLGIEIKSKTKLEKIIFKSVQAGWY